MDSGSKNLKLIFAIIYIFLLIVIDMAAYAILSNDNFKMITYNDVVEDDCYAVRVDVAYAIDAGVSPVTTEKKENKENKGFLDMIVGENGSDERVTFLAISVLDAMLLVVILLLYGVVVNIMDGRREYVPRFGAFLGIFLALCVFVGVVFFLSITKEPPQPKIRSHAPIIYMYDENEREVSVKLALNGDLTCTYPSYNEDTGWVVKTSEDGTLTDRSGRQYEYLFWEADLYFEPDLSRGFCVRGEDAAAFLEDALSQLGLSDTEANAFIMYWLPKLEANAYNVISFQTENFEDAAVLDLSVTPDTVVRVNMLFYASDEYVEMIPQDLSNMNPSLDERHGFVLVEWGGEQI
ncbi:MAG: hypothetical protein J6Y08_04030 [Clostridiales bacterium]|nr:hypothetical protein [Clostridiales bacterium]